MGAPLSEVGECVVMQEIKAKIVPSGADALKVISSCLSSAKERLGVLVISSGALLTPPRNSRALAGRKAL